jgi:hypothetical protein
MENHNNKKNNPIADYLFIGFMFIGMAVGIAFNKLGAGIMAGMGLGFVACAVFTSEKNKL